MDNAQTNIEFLLEYCQDIPELYNRVSTRLWADFDIKSAELSLLCTFMVNEFTKEVKDGKENKSTNNATN